MRRYARLTATASWLVIAACAGQSGPPALTELCGVRLLDTTDWVHSDEGNFTLLVPPSYGERRLDGIDSYAGGWTTETRSLSFDWGRYSNPLESGSGVRATDPDYCDASPLGAERLFLSTDADNPSERVVAVHWSGLEADGQQWKQFLTLVGRGRGQNAIPEFLTIFSTIRVKDDAEIVPW